MDKGTWIYYYASFGPGHQSHDYGFNYFHSSYGMEDIKDNLLRSIDSNGYSICLSFWKVKRPNEAFIQQRIESAIDKKKRIERRIARLEATKGFESKQVEGSDPVLKRNLSRRDDKDILRRLHRAGYMYTAEDLVDWHWEKKKLVEPERSKVLKIIRRVKRY